MQTLSVKDLECMLIELTKKEEELTLRIHGLKENINNEKKIKNALEKDISELKGDISNIETNIMKCNEENAFTVKTIENDLTHYKNVNNIGVRNYNYKIEEELKKQNELKEKIKNVYEEITNCVKSINMESVDLKKINSQIAQMEKFISSI
jgi:archaellum component FlaC